MEAAMPDYTYTGPERTYPESRDAYQVPVGTVKPGDVLELTGPLDQDWREYEGDAKPRVLIEGMAAQGIPRTDAEPAAGDGAEPVS
jgi:hypothetical protein